MAAAVFAGTAVLVTAALHVRRRGAPPDNPYADDVAAASGELAAAVRSIAPVQSRVFTSAKVAAAVKASLAREVAGASGTTLADIANVVTDAGGKLCVTGPFLRATVMHTQDHRRELFDSIFTCPASVLVEAAKARGWPCVSGVDSFSGFEEDGFVEIGTPGSPSAFRGYVRAAACEAAFTVDSVEFEVSTGALIDPSGLGLADAGARVLRIPSASRHGWHKWVLDDRLWGWRLLQYLWLRSQGFEPSGLDLQHFVIVTLANELEARKGALEKTIVRFFDTVVLGGASSPADALAREQRFRELTVEEFQLVRGMLLLEKGDGSGGHATTGKQAFPHHRESALGRTSAVLRGEDGSGWYAHFFGSLYGDMSPRDAGTRKAWDERRTQLFLSIDD